MFKRKPQRVYVLGAGPAGLLAAHAATTKGYEPTVLSKPDPMTGKVKKSDLFGCQYLHQSIPGITYTIDGMPVRYKLDGPVDGYRSKVYGDNWQGTVSPDEYGPEKQHYAWDLRKAYDKLWDRYGTTAVPVELSPGHMQAMFDDQYGFILNTLPAPALCRDRENHKFASQSIWAMGTVRAHNADVQGMPYIARDMTVECNGWRDTAWYRAATVFGYSTLEWPGGKKPPIAGVAAVSKPLSTDCKCWLGKRGVRLGRYGTWTKGVLVHEAYYGAMQALP